jgi:hypothetical protein
VGFAGWTFGKGKGLPPAGSKFFRYVADETGRPEWKTSDLDISEEAWLAQEDLWIQTELYRLVKKANDSVANFEAVKGEKGEFVNPYWKVKILGVDGDRVKLSLTNRLDRPQPVHLTFLVQLQPGGKYHQLQPIKDSAPLPPKGARDEKGDPRDTLVRELKILEAPAAKQVVGVRQVLTWETAAVRRIDHVSIGAGGGDEWSHSHRTAHKQLQPFKKKPVEEKKEGEGSGPGGGGLLAAGKPGDMMKKGSGSAGFGALFGKSGPGGTGSAEAGRTPNGLLENRYLEVTPQARRVPVAIVLIVDQAHVARVQTAFADSPLRFLITQVLMHRYPKSVRPDVPSQPGAGGEAVAGGGGPTFGGLYGSGGVMGFPGRPGGGAKAMGSAAFQPPPSAMQGSFMPSSLMKGPFNPGSFMKGSFMPGGSGFGSKGYPGMSSSSMANMGMPGLTYGAAETALVGDEQEANVELVLYGLVSLYERYPSRPASALPAVEGANPAEGKQ